MSDTNSFLTQSLVFSSLPPDRNVEFLLSGDVLSLAVTRAELHLHIFNPLHLDVRPVLPSRAEDGLPTR